MNSYFAFLLLLSACGSAEPHAEPQLASAQLEAEAQPVGEGADQGGDRAAETQPSHERAENGAPENAPHAEGTQGEPMIAQRVGSNPDVWEGDRERALLVVVTAREELLRRERAMLSRMQQDLERLGFEVSTSEVGNTAAQNTAVNTLLGGQTPVFPAEWEAAGLIVIMRLRDPYETSEGRRITMGLSDVAILRAPAREPVYLERTERNPQDHRRGDFAESGEFLREYLEMDRSR